MENALKLIFQWVHVNRRFGLCQAVWMMDFSLSEDMHFIFLCCFCFCWCLLSFLAPKCRTDEMQMRTVLRLYRLGLHACTFM